MNVRAAIVWITVLSCSSAQGAANSAPPAAPASLEEARNAVVLVQAQGRSGTGFLWEQPHRIVTALHVVAKAKEVLITYHLPSGQTVRKAKIARILSTRDLALLELLEGQAALDAPYVFRQTRSNLSGGTEVHAIGFPLHILRANPTYLKVRDARVPLEKIIPPSEKRRLQRMDILKVDMPVVDLQGPLVPGLSGCPVLTADCHLVGIGHGGLERGHVDRCWAIASSEVPLLLSSQEKTVRTGLSTDGNLFSAAAEYFDRLVGLDPKSKPLVCGGSVQGIVGGSTDQEAIYGILVERPGYLHVTITNRHQRGKGRGTLGRYRLHDALGEDLGVGSRIGPGGSRPYGPLPVSGARVYFLRLTPKDKALAVPFEVHCHWEKPDFIGDVEGATRDDPHDISGAQTIRDTVGFGRNTEDWYRLVVPSDGTLSFEIENLREKGSPKGTLSYRIGRPQGKALKQSNMLRPRGLHKSRQVTVMAGDEFLVYVHPTKDLYASSYRLTWYLDSRP